MTDQDTNATQLLIECQQDRLGCSTEAPPDGKFYRFGDPEKSSGNKNCFAMLNEEGTFGVYGNWGTGEQYYWFGETSAEISADELAALQQRIDATHQDQADQRCKDQNTAAEEARSLIDKSSDPRPDHPYLKKKIIAATNSRQYGERLLMPMQNVAGEIRNTQQIYPDGTKRFLKGGAVSGNFSLIGADQLPTSGALFVCEGWATGVTLNQQRSAPVAAAMNAGNLPEVCKQLREVLPDGVNIVVAADDDRNTHGNPGLAMAFLAAEQIGAEVIRPEFPCSDCECTDFNDLAACPEAPKAHSARAVDSQKQGPIPLKTSLPPVKPLVAAMLPDSFVGFVMSTSERLQVPPDYLAVTAIAVAAGIIGGKATVHPKQRDPWKVTPTVWAGLVGGPSTLKSACMGAATEPLREIEKDLEEEYKTAKSRHALVEEFSSDGVKEAKANAAKLFKLHPDKAIAMVEDATFDEPPPVAQRYGINDATVEKLGEILAENSNGLLLIRDEISGWLAKLADEKFQGDRAFYLECFEGQNSFVYDRIGRGTIRIEHCILSIVGGIQPSKLSPVIQGALQGSTDDGLIQRFQFAIWPDVRTHWKWVDTPRDEEAYQRYREALQSLHELPRLGEEGALPSFRFSAKAHALFRTWVEQLQASIRNDDWHPVMQSHLTKMQKTIAGLALIFELLDGGRSEVGEAATVKALLWSDYLISHANRLYSMAADQQYADAKLLLNRQNRLPEIFTVRNVQRRNWTGLTTPGTVAAALEVLVEHRYLTEIPVPSSASGGRPTTRYRWIGSTPLKR